MKVLVVGIYREWGRAALNSNGEVPTLFADLRSALLDAVHQEVANDFELAGWLEQIGLFLVGQFSCRCESQQAVGGVVVALGFAFIPCDLVGNAQAERGVLVELEQSGEFAFADDLAVHDVRCHDEHAR